MFSTNCFSRRVLLLYGNHFSFTMLTMLSALNYLTMKKWDRTPQTKRKSMGKRTFKQNHSRTWRIVRKEEREKRESEKLKLLKALIFHIFFFKLHQLIHIEFDALRENILISQFFIIPKLQIKWTYDISDNKGR